VEDAAPPNSTAAPVRGAPSSARNGLEDDQVAALVVITAGLGEIPASCMVTCGPPGKARPMPSASTREAPSAAAQVIGSTPFPPPISPAIQRGHRAPGQVLQVVAETFPFVTILDLLDADGRGANPAARHDQR